MKTVFTNAMCAHVWAQQSQPHGRSNSMSFNGDTLYSYGTPIARILTTKRRKVLLLTSCTYSVTTTGHCSQARHAFTGPTFTVPSLGLSGGRHREPGDTLDHISNLAYLTAEYAAELLRLRRARTQRWSTPFDRLRYYSEPAHAYAKLFNLPSPRLRPEKDAAAIERHYAERDARCNTPTAIAKRAKAAAQREAREAEQQRLRQLAGAERIAAWRAGEQVSPPWSPFALLRVRGELVETSLGATVPLRDAQTAFTMVARCQAAGTSWESNGQRIHLGQFTLDTISPNGNIVAGCHRIEWSEIENLARKAGWIA